MGLTTRGTAGNDSIKGSFKKRAGKARGQAVYAMKNTCACGLPMDPVGAASWAAVVEKPVAVERKPFGAPSTRTSGAYRSHCRGEAASRLCGRSIGLAAEQSDSDVVRFSERLRPSTPSSRPMPESFQPPKGACKRRRHVRRTSCLLSLAEPKPVEGPRTGSASPRGQEWGATPNAANIVQ
jgi:hypothetical protein